MVGGYCVVLECGRPMFDGGGTMAILCSPLFECDWPIVECGGPVVECYGLMFTECKGLPLRLS